MSNETEHVLWIVEKWQELTGLAAVLLAIFGITRKKTSGKMLVTREYFDNRLELHNEQIKNTVKDGVKDGLKEVYDEIHRVDGRVDDHLNKVKL